MNFKLVPKPYFAVVALFALIVTAVADVNVTIRRAPYDVPNVSSKSEIAHKPCDFCGSSVSYERKYRWDTVRHEWIETTKAENVPAACRKCKKKLQEQEKLDQRERDLDRRIDQEKKKSRILSKEKKLKRLRNANR